MTDNIVTLHAVEKVVAPEKKNFWNEAALTAVKNNAIYGILIYVNSDGDTCYISIGADRPSFRGLIEEIRDEISGRD